jgi:hypothetical protein
MRLAPVIAMLTLLLAAPAFADVSPDVKKYVGSAAALFEKLEYEKALAQLKRAKAKSQGPEDDLRIALYEGIVLAEMGDATAPAAFASALGMDPNAQLPLVVSPKVQRVFDKAKAQVQKVVEAEAEAQRQREAAEKAKQEEKRKQEEASKPPPPKEQPVVVEQPKPPPPEPSPGIRRFWWAPAAVAGVAGATAAGLLISAKSAQDQLKNNVPTNREEALATANRGANLQVAGWVMVGVAAAAAAATVGLFALGGSSQASASVIVTPSGAAASLSVPLP